MTTQPHPETTLAGSDELTKLMPYLLSGGAGALAGGLLTGKRRAKKGESRLSHLSRVLGNAAIAGGLSAGAAALVEKGVTEMTGKNSPQKLVDGAPEDNQGPLESNLRRAAFALPAAGIAGTAGLLATNSAGIFGAGSKVERQLHATNLAKKLGIKSQSDFMLTSPSELNSHIEGAAASAAGIRAKEIEADALAAHTAAELKLAGSGTAAADSVRNAMSGVLSAEHAGASEAAALNKIRRAAGMAGGNSLLHRIASYTTRRGLSTFGQSNPKRFVRGGIGLIAASLPALVGSLVTPDHTNDNA